MTEPNEIDRPPEGSEGAIPPEGGPPAAGADAESPAAVDDMIRALAEAKLDEGIAPEAGPSPGADAPPAVEEPPAAETPPGVEEPPLAADAPPAVEEPPAAAEAPPAMEEPPAAEPALDPDVIAELEELAGIDILAEPGPEVGAKPPAEDEPVAEPAPTAAAEPVAEPGPAAEAEPDEEPAPAAEAEPDEEPAPFAAAEPVEEPAPPAGLEPGEEPEPDSAPAPDRDPAPRRRLPAFRPPAPRKIPTALPVMTAAAVLSLALSLATVLKANEYRTRIEELSRIARDPANVSHFRESNLKLMQEGRYRRGALTIVYGADVGAEWKLLRALREKNIVNRSISGQNMIQLMLRAEQDVVSLVPMQFVLLPPLRDVVKPQQLLLQTRILGEAVLDCGILPILATIPPIAAESDSAAGTYVGRIAKVNRGLKELGERMGWPVVDLFAPLVGDHNYLRREFAGSGPWPNQDGYRVLTQTLEAFIDSLSQGDPVAAGAPVDQRVAERGETGRRAP